MSQELKLLVHVSRNGELPDFLPSSTLSDLDTPHVLKSVPPRNGCKAERSVQHVAKPSSHLSSAPTEEIP